MVPVRWDTGTTRQNPMTEPNPTQEGFDPMTTITRLVERQVRRHTLEQQNAALRHQVDELRRALTASQAAAAVLMNAPHPPLTLLTPA